MITIPKFNLSSLFKSYFLLSILLLALLPLMIVTYLTAIISQDILEKQLIKKLALLANDKALAIEQYIMYLQGQLKVIAFAPSLLAVALSEQTPSAQTKQELKKYEGLLENFLSVWFESTDYEQLFMFNNDRELIFSFPEKYIKGIENEQIKETLDKVIENSKILMGATLSEFTYIDQSGHHQEAAFIAYPLIYQRNIIGTLVLRFINTKINEIVSDNSSLGKTGATIVGMLHNDKIELMIPLKKNEILVEGGPTEYYLKQAALGMEGEGIFTDYRGEQVLAAWRHLAALRWGMIVKLDNKVALAPVIELRRRIIVLSLISLFLVALIANFISNKLQQTEHFLTNVINSISSILVIIDSSTKIVRWNRATAEILHLKEEAIKNMPLVEIFPYLSPYLNKIEQAITENRLAKIDRIALQNRQYAAVVIYPLIHKKFNGAVILIEDITERVKLMENIAQTDKLASVGVLTAGIAHEINNPVNFITSSIPPLKRDIADVLTILNKYFELDPESPSKEKLTEVKQLREELDLDYTLEEINKLVDGMQDGAERTTTIVKDLRTFSRLDEAEMKKVNLQEGIDSTLTLLRNKYKHKVDIQKEYGNIPEVECHPGKLNQVFMNILANAIDAIPEKGVITIKTYLADDQHVGVSIKDTGTGMTEAVKAKIFEPFFTTKGVGAGTGLGLAITYGIIRDHKGEILVQSEPGKGTEFIVILPIHQT